jgi:hypothetical protein
MFRLYIGGHQRAGCRALNKKTGKIQYNSEDENWSLHQCTIIQEYIKVHGNICRLQEGYVKLRGLFKFLNILQELCC